MTTEKRVPKSGAMADSLAAVVLCAGKGTRMNSNKSKVLHAILGRPICAYPLARALEAGATRVVAVVGHQAESVEKAIATQFPGKPIDFAIQKEQRGTADAVKAAASALASHQGPVLILYGDTPLVTTETLSALLEAYRSSGGKLALVSTTPPNPFGYGRVIREGGKATRIVEEKDCSAEQKKIGEVNAGIYAVDGAFLWSALGKIESRNAQGEFYLTDIVEQAANQGPVAVVNGDFIETAGVNDRVELAACARVLQQRINTRHMKAGVTMVDPSTTFIADDVIIGSDTELGAMVTLEAGCRIGKNVRIGQGSVIMRSEVGDGAQIKPYSVIEEAIVGARGMIGPFSRLRTGTQLAEDVHIGNFVETKKTKIARGSKANHLSYLGDAEIGSGVNVGAGTITCNYDGKNKHPTVIEDNVFIGSDTQLVAPVRIGAGTLIAAGTTVTADVPPNSLAISRVPQVVKEGWVAKKRAKG